jgi:[acyl-carrier-protein] S-malonyltransferase
MEKIGFVFPGQGSQKVGMGLDLAEAYPDLVDTYYRHADDLLGLPLSRLCWEGPADELRDTSVTQPAIFLTSLCILTVLRHRGLEPDVVAGHSLGEYSALVAAGVLEWTDALLLVRLRGQLMAGVNARVPGSMAAILGLGLADVEALCLQAAEESGQIVEVANDNEPTQIVVSGQVAGVARAIELAKAAGAARAVLLEVGAPFHCSLMAEIEEQFAAALAAVEFREPRVELVSSVTARPLAGADEVRRVLQRQLTGRVRWTGTVERMAGSGVGRFVEVGPGKVLGGLCRRIAPDVPVHATYDLRQCALTLEAAPPADRAAAALR